MSTAELQMDRGFLEQRRSSSRRTRSRAGVRSDPSGESQPGHAARAAGGRPDGGSPVRLFRLVGLLVQWPTSVRVSLQAVCW